MNQRIQRIQIRPLFLFGAAMVMDTPQATAKAEARHASRIGMPDWKRPGISMAPPDSGHQVTPYFKPLNKPLSANK